MTDERSRPPSPGAARDVRTGSAGSADRPEEATAPRAASVPGATAQEAPAGERTPEPSPEADAEAPRPQYWLRVHGYMSDLSREIAYYHDFFDLRQGPLPDNPEKNLRPGDVIIFYADGPGALYGVGTVSGPVRGPFQDPRRGQVWEVPIKREVLVKEVSKGPHAVILEPPSGLRFARWVREYTYIRLPEEDGPYLVEQVKARAGRAE